MSGKIWEAIVKTGFINVEAAKNFAVDTEDAYFDILEIFYNKLQNQCQTLERYLKNADLPNFAILVHGMKSSLITIGALCLSETALRLETAAKNGDMRFCEDNLSGFLEQLDGSHAQLTEIFNIKYNTATENLPQGDRVYLCENAKTALNAAKAYDGSAGLEAIEELLKYDYGAETNGLLKNIRAALKCFDFDEAVKLLRKMLKI